MFAGTQEMPEAKPDSQGAEYLANAQVLSAPILFYEPDPYRRAAGGSPKNREGPAGELEPTCVCHTSHLPPERERSRRVLGLS